VAFASKVTRPEADALLCSCTAWRSLEAVAELERCTGKPVISSNQASLWAAYRAIGLTPKITGFGRLLESLAA
jgi:maleate isomerase